VSRRLLLLNLALAAAVVWAGVELRGQWQASKARESAMVHGQVRPQPIMPLAPLPNPPAVMATSYQKIADEMLFDPSRNSRVPIPQPPPPPAPVPTPPLPVYHGLMNLGDGPMAILSVNAAAPHQGVHPGETIGEFTLVAVDTQEITLRWRDRVVRKSVDELANHLPVPQEAAAVRTEAAPPVIAPAEGPVAAGPQGQERTITKLCAKNDSYPEGAEVDGYRKVLAQTPGFGKACFWELIH
jgi:hypothetical protein